MAMDDRIEGWHMLLQVLGRLDGKSLATAASVSCLWSQVASQEELWKDLCLAKWPSLDSQAGVSVVNEAGSYRQLYALRYQAQRGCLGHIKPWLSMDDLIFLVDVTAGAEEVVCSFIRRGSELCPVFVCDEMFRFLATLREEEQGKAAVGGFGEMKGLKVSWAVMVKGSQKVFQVMDNKSAGKTMMGNACINFSENLPDHPGCALGFSQHVAEVDLRFSVREDGNLVTSEVCLSILNTLTWRRLDLVPELFDEMPERDETSWNASFQIQIKLLSGKTLLHWVGSQDLVKDLTHALELKLGIPSAAQRLLHEGKQLEDLYPLSFYSIKRNASIILSLRLRGGAAGQSSSAKAFSYKDVVHTPRQEKTVPPVQAPKPFLVDKLEETPSIEIVHPTLDEQAQQFAEHGIICRFNGLWPRTADLYQWIHSNWTNNCKVLLCSKGFFITVFAFEEDYQKALKAGPWFWGSAGLFLTPWFPDFDPSSAIITKLPIWVRLPNLPAHLWHFAVFQGIGNSLGRFLDTDISRGEKGLYTFARICAEIDISKGLPDKINLKIGDFHWTQYLDYENTAFRCRNCHLTGHLQSSCPSKPDPKKKANPKQKSKSWKPHDPPPMDDFDFSSDEEELNEEEMETKTAQEPPSADPVDLSVQSSSQKRNHESSTSDSDKEISQSAQLSLQITRVQECPPEWVKVGKKKGKKSRIVDPSHVG